MKVAVTGASGIQGMSAMIYLLEQDDVYQVQVSDVYHLERLKDGVERLNVLSGPKPEVCPVEPQ